MSDKKKYPAALGLEVAADLLRWIGPNCDRTMIAGSLRRGRAEVGDVEILYQSRRVVPAAMDFFAPAKPVDSAEGAITRLLMAGVLEYRLSQRGTRAWGSEIKLAVHVATGVPVDLFAAPAECWWNRLVCRTGGKVSNIAICDAARRRGWKWEPYSVGFSKLAGLGKETHAVGSEEEVFEFVGLRYLQPEERP